MNKIPLLVASLVASVLVAKIASDDHKIQKLQTSLVSLQASNQELSRLYKESLSNVTPEECEQRIQKSKVEGTIRHLVPGLDQKHIPVIAEAVLSSAKEYKIDPDLVLAIAHEESRFNPSATSPVGAIGVMQVMPFWADSIDWVSTPEDLRDIEKNIRAGTFILNEYLQMFNGNRRMALLAYNRGPGAVMQDLHQGNDPDNGYPSLVLARYELIRRSY